MIDQGINERLEQLRIPRRKTSGGNEVDDGFQLIIPFIKATCPIASGLQIVDFLGGEPEEEEILRSDFFSDFDIGAVQSADRERSIHRELHVPGS